MLRLQGGPQGGGGAEGMLWRGGCRGNLCGGFGGLCLYLGSVSEWVDVQGEIVYECNN